MVSKKRAAPSSGKYKIINKVIEINPSCALRIVDLAKETITLNLILNIENKEVSIKGEALEMKLFR